MPSSDLAFALELADLADSLSLPRFRSLDLRVETKPDLTPVTDADRTVERALRELIDRSRPGEGVFGEEEGDDGGAIRWVIDPIDATKNFLRGVPVWATLIALEREAEVACGVVSAPALGHRWWAAPGAGAFRDGERVRVSAVPRLADAAVSSTYGRDLVAVERVAWHARSLGDFWQHVLVARRVGRCGCRREARALGLCGARADPGGGGRSSDGARRRRATPQRASRYVERIAARRVARAPGSVVATNGESAAESARMAPWFA